MAGAVVREKNSEEIGFVVSDLISKIIRFAFDPFDPQFNFKICDIYLFRFPSPAAVACF